MASTANELEEWSGSPAPESPDDWWIDDATGEYINADTGERMTAEAGRTAIAAINENRAEAAWEARSVPDDSSYRRDMQNAGRGNLLR